MPAPAAAPPPDVGVTRGEAGAGAGADVPPPWAAATFHAVVPAAHTTRRTRTTTWPSDRVGPPCSTGGNRSCSQPRTLAPRPSGRCACLPTGWSAGGAASRSATAGAVAAPAPVLPPAPGLARRTRHRGRRAGVPPARGGSRRAPRSAAPGDAERPRRRGPGQSCVNACEEPRKARPHREGQVVDLWTTRPGTGAGGRVPAGEVDSLQPVAFIAVDEAAPRNGVSQGMSELSCLPWHACLGERESSDIPWKLHAPGGTGGGPAARAVSVVRRRPRPSRGRRARRSRHPPRRRAASRPDEVRRQPLAQVLGQHVGLLEVGQVRDGDVDLAVPAAATASSSSRLSARAEVRTFSSVRDAAVHDLQQRLHRERGSQQSGRRRRCDRPGGGTPACRRRTATWSPRLARRAASAASSAEPPGVQDVGRGQHRVPGRHARAAGCRPPGPGSGPPAPPAAPTRRSRSSPPTGASRPPPRRRPRRACR